MELCCSVFHFTVATVSVQEDKGLVLPEEKLSFYHVCTIIQNHRRLCSQIHISKLRSILRESNPARACIWSDDGALSLRSLTFHSDNRKSTQPLYTQAQAWKSQPIAAVNSASLKPQHVPGDSGAVGISKLCIRRSRAL